MIGSRFPVSSCKNALDLLPLQQKIKLHPLVDALNSGHIPAALGGGLVGFSRWDRYSTVLNCTVLCLF